METKMSYRINHQKLTGEWCKHVKGRFRKIVSKRRRLWLKKETNLEIGER